MPHKEERKPQERADQEEEATRKQKDEEEEEEEEEDDEGRNHLNAGEVRSKQIERTLRHSSMPHKNERNPQERRGGEKEKEQKANPPANPPASMMNQSSMANKAHLGISQCHILRVNEATNNRATKRSNDNEDDDDKAHDSYSSHEAKEAHEAHQDEAHEANEVDDHERAQLRRAQ